MLIDKMQEISCKILLCCFAKGRIKLEDIPLAFFFEDNGSVVFRFCLQCDVIATYTCFFVKWCS